MAVPLRTGPWINKELRRSTSAWAMPLDENLWRAVPHLLAPTLAWIPNSDLAFLFWLWGTSLSTLSHQLVGIFCQCNMPKPNYLLTCCCTSQINFHGLPELKMISCLCLKMNRWKNKAISYHKQVQSRNRNFFFPITLFEYLITERKATI